MNNIEAAIGIIIKKNKVYITKNKRKNNLWEFPGGKVKKYENITNALKRELLEEAGIIVLKMCFFQYIYYNRRLKLYFFLIKKWKGEPYSREGYDYIWKLIHNLQYYHFPSANLNVIKNLKKKY